MLGKLFLPGMVAVGFFLFTHQSTHTHIAAAYVSQACDAGDAGVSAAFAWPPPAAGAEQTWVDLGVDGQFALGWYQGHGPLPPSQNTLSVGGLAAGAKYYYRVNALAGGKWTTIAKGSFVAGCTPVPDAPPSTATPGPAAPVAE